MSSLVKLAVLLLAAAVLAVGARAWMVNNERRAGQLPTDPTVQVLATATNLPAGLLLRESDLTWIQRKHSEVPRNAQIEGGDLIELRGALLRRRLEAGSLLLTTDVLRADAPGFLAAALQPGMRAVSVPVDDVSGNAGLIQPGDYVDMILTQQLAQGDERLRGSYRVVSETVVEHARIIAVGSSFQRETDKKLSARARTVTLEVSSRAAEAVTVAAQLGNLSMALRSFAIDDRTASDMPDEASVVAWTDSPHNMPSGPVWGHDVSRALDNADKPSEATQATATPEAVQRATRRVVIMRGSETREQELGAPTR